MEVLGYTKTPDAFTNVKEIFSDCREICNHFAQDLPSSYKHERCERFDDI